MSIIQRAEASESNIGLSPIIVSTPRIFSM
jgi:hypothetical protein